MFGHSNIYMVSQFILDTTLFRILQRNFTNLIFVTALLFNHTLSSTTQSYCHYSIINTKVNIQFLRTQRSPENTIHLQVPVVSERK